MGGCEWLCGDLVLKERIEKFSKLGFLYYMSILKGLIFSNKVLLGIVIGRACWDWHIADHCS